MEKEEINKILSKHKKWLRTNGKVGSVANFRYINLRHADLNHADLRYADLRYADLRAADLDFSVFPLWCGGLEVNIDDRQAIQLLYHLIRNVNYSKNCSESMKKLLNIDSLVKQANKFHRIDECGIIKEIKQCLQF